MNIEHCNILIINKKLFIFIYIYFLYNSKIQLIKKIKKNRQYLNLKFI